MLLSKRNGAELNFTIPRKYWLVPLIVALVFGLLVGLLLILTGNAPINAPFIYTIF